MCIISESDGNTLGTTLYAV